MIICEKKEKPDNVVFDNRRTKYTHVYNEIAEMKPGEYVECSGFENNKELSRLQQSLLYFVKRNDSHLKYKLIEQGCKIKTKKTPNPDGSYSLWVTKYEVAPN